MTQTHARGDAAAPAVDIDGVTFTYPTAAAPALERVRLKVEPGERLGVLGPNGGGKSTMLKLVLGLLTPASGAVRVFGAPADSPTARGLIGYVPQRVTAELNFPLSVRDVVRMPVEVAAGRLRPVAADREADVDRCLALVGMADLADRRIGALSGGQVQRVMIARAVAGRPRLLLLDEPTVGIDVAGQRRFAEMLGALAGELGLTIITVSHDLRTVALSSDRVACLHRTLHYHDAPHGLTPKVLSELFSHDIEAVFGGGPGDPPPPAPHRHGDGCAHH